MTSDTHETKTVRARIHGRVQGVSYRYWTVQQATKRGVHGWVRNRMDGTVEAVFHGDAQRIDDVLAACHDGPSLAAVDKIDTEPAEYDGPEEFTQEPTK